jgi:hypothetical protein
LLCRADLKQSRSLSKDFFFYAEIRPIKAAAQLSEFGCSVQKYTQTKPQYQHSLLC